MEKLFCRTCAEEAFKTWKGWPPTNRQAASGVATVPHLPLLSYGLCRKCGGVSRLPASHIRYVNVHSLTSTGLPDYFALEVHQPDTALYKWLSEFGTPYPITPASSSAPARRRPPKSQ
jgi:hypothetical protein